MYARDLGWKNLGDKFRIEDGANAYEGTLWRVDVEAEKVHEFSLGQDPKFVDPVPGRTSISIDIGHAENVRVSQIATAEEI